MLKSSLVDQLYDIIKERIVSLQLKLGKKIDVQKLAEEFGVSQMPVRDTLNRLSQNGLVNTRARVGYYVIKLSSEDMREIYDLRLMFELHALKTAVNDIKTDKLEKVDQGMRDLQKETNKERKKIKFGKLDRELHLLIIRNCNNQRLQKLFSQIYDFVKISQYLYPDSGFEEDLKEHGALLESLLQRNLSKATKRLSQHINNARDRIMKTLGNNL